MIQWANIRDECGNIIGQANAGDWIEIYYEDCETGRLWIYDYTVGIYGSVLADCVYGTYQWDGSGDNGYYNCYQGDADYSGCDYDYDCGDYDYGCCDTRIQAVAMEPIAMRTMRLSARQSRDAHPTTQSAAAMAGGAGDAEQGRHDQLQQLGRHGSAG